MRLTNGQLVRVRAAGTSDDWCMGRVALVSGNGKSAGLWLDGMVRAQGGYIGGFLPLTIDEERGLVTGLMGEEYEVEVRGE